MKDFGKHLKLKNFSAARALVVDETTRGLAIIQSASEKEFVFAELLVRAKNQSDINSYGQGADSQGSGV